MPFGRQGADIASTLRRTARELVAAGASIAQGDVLVESHSVQAQRGASFERSPASTARLIHSLFVQARLSKLRIRTIAGEYKTLAVGLDKPDRAWRPSFDLDACFLVVHHSE